jgi:drug/metabolite transporter (DMT)-like permease
MKHGLSTHAYGLLITVLGVLILCPDTLLIRLVQAEGGSQWTIAFWRGVLTCAGLVVFYRLAEGPGSLRSLVRPDKWVILAALTMGGQALAFILSVTNTSVANTLVIVATGPLFTALFAWAFLNERPPLRTWVTIAAAFSGMLIIFYHDLGSESLVGDLLALVTAAGLGISFVIVRHRKEVNMMPAMAIGKLLSALAVLPLAAPFALSAAGMGLMALLGLIVLPLAFGLLTLGPRYIPAPEVSLLMLMETVLGPLIVWAAIGEAASTSTIIGGSIVLAALAVNAALGMWRHSAARVRTA